MAANSVFGKLLSAFASEIDRFDTDVVSAMTNAIPGLSDSTMLLPDWETDLGLPEECMASFYDSQTVAQRRAAVHSKYTLKISSLSEQFFIDLAASLGITITILSEGGIGTPFRTDSIPALGGDGDVTRVGPEILSAASSFRLWSVSRLHHWIVRYPDSHPNSELMICYFEKLKPAHTVMIPAPY